MESRGTVSGTGVTPTYKLLYFPAKALAEPIRFLFSYGKIEFEDFRFDKEKMWPKLKPEMPFCQAPVLEINGIKTHQSVAICRYLAKDVNLTGANNFEDLEIDAMVDTIVDFRNKIWFYAYAKTEAIKETFKKPLFEETIPFYLARLESITLCNSGYLAVGRLTWADLFFVSNIDFMNFMAGISLLEGFPNLLQLEEKVLTLSGIKEWIDRRPYSDR